MAASFGIFAVVRGWEHAALREELRQRGLERVELLRTKVFRSSEVLYGIRSFFAVHPNPTRAEFRAFVAPALERQLELRALEWVPRVTHAQRQEAETRGAQDGFRNFQFTQKDDANHLMRDADRPEYFPVLYVEPVVPNQRAAGYDLLSSPSRRPALEESRDNDALVATCPITLAQETDADQHGFLVFLPVYAETPQATVESRRDHLAGFALAVFRFADLVDSALAPLAASGVDVVLKDEAWPDAVYSRTADSNRRPPFWLKPFHPPIRHLEEVFPLDIAGRRWLLALHPTQGFVLDHYSWQSWSSLFIGLLLTACLGSYLVNTARHTAMVQSHVTRRTRQLSSEIQDRQRAESLARTAEAKYRSIFENAIEGIFQTTPDGHYLAANRSLALMYGYDTPESLMSALNNIASDLYVDPRGARRLLTRCKPMTQYGILSRRFTGATGP